MMNMSPKEWIETAYSFDMVHNDTDLNKILIQDIEEDKQPTAKSQSHLFPILVWKLSLVSDFMN